MQNDSPKYAPILIDLYYYIIMIVLRIDLEIFMYKIFIR